MVAAAAAGTAAGLGNLDHEGMFDEDDEDEDDEDEDEDMDEDEEDDGLRVGSMQVHDLHVEEGGAGAAARPAGAQEPKTAAPAAAPAPAAAAAARPAAWGAAARGGNGSGGDSGGAGGTAAAAAAAAVRSELPRLVFYMGSEKLSPSTTVFQAIQQLAMAGRGATEGAEDEEEAEGEPRGRRLWDTTYTLHYRTADASDAIPSSSTVAADSAPASAKLGKVLGVAETVEAAEDAGVPLGSLLPLAEVGAAVVPGDVCASEACKDILALIQVLEAVNRVGPRMCTAACSEHAGATCDLSTGKAGCTPAPVSDGGDQPVYGQVLREEFVCSKLASKLGQQLKDVLSICGGGLPAWCRQLVFSCKHLFPFEVRSRYFYCTAFGLGRALQHMQTMHAAELGGAPGAADRDGRDGLRVGRLQRQKVRVSRKRILDSAVKVMELYAKQRAVLELEYFGEVGTGLGPTLEFYTLLSHDLQRRSLKMWRHEDAASPDNMAADSDAASPAEDGGEARPMSRTPSMSRAASMSVGQRPAAAVALPVEAWHDDSEYVNAPWGLFPAPLPPSQRGPDSKVVPYFKLLGRTLAKALQDHRLMDLPLNYTFYR